MIKEKIREFAKELGLEKVGFSHNAVVALFPYFVKDEDGNISMYARGLDYHRVAEDKLKRLEAFLQTLGATETFVHADKGTLDDRRAAYDAGLGFFGENGMLICHEYGSYFFIGQVVHNLKIERDMPTDEKCLSCGACKRLCPGGALSGDGFKIDRCLSEISQKRGELSSAEHKLVKDRGICWGCDMCQAVCPHNKDLPTTAMPEFLEQRITQLKPQDVECLSNREFKEKFGEYAFSWRGKGVLERNLQILFSHREDINE